MFLLWSLFREEKRKEKSKASCLLRMQKPISYTNAIFFGQDPEDLSAAKGGTISLTRDSEEEKDEGSLGAHSLGLAFTCQRPHQLNNTHSVASEMLRDLCMGAVCKLHGMWWWDGQAVFNWQSVKLHA